MSFSLFCSYVVRQTWRVLAILSSLRRTARAEAGRAIWEPTCNMVAGEGRRMSMA